MKNVDGSVTFYTTGVSQGQYLDSMGSSFQRIAWESWAEGIATKMSQNGGSIVWPIPARVFVECGNIIPPQQPKTGIICPPGTRPYEDWTLMGGCEEIAERIKNQ